ncbi:MAG: TIGR00159 family protein [Desulfobacteraceae bacterium]|nr:TIGR00159 family protein [Desulfobacteraceae bacterium]
MHLYSIIANLRFQDILDIVFLTIVSYHLYLWFRGTKAYRALIGLLVLGIIFTVARTWGLFLTTWVFQVFWQVLVILLIILFQSEIRQVLERVNPLQAIGLRKAAIPEKWIPGFTQGIFELAKRKIGALIIIERQDGVREYITEGQSLEGEPIPEVLMSIFQKESPLHDGATLIQGGRITQVACYLPLSPEEGLPKAWGTRHRAALGLSERCDAWCVVVSEERSEVSVARQNEMIHIEQPQQLTQFIMEAVMPYSPKKITWQERLRLFLLTRWQVKLGTLFLISIIWLMLAGQQDFESAFSIPLAIENLPPKMQILEPMNPRVKIRVRGLRKDASILNEKNVLAHIDLSLARPGKTTFPVTREHIRLPNDRIYVVNIEPPQIEFKFK